MSFALQWNNLFHAFFLLNDIPSHCSGPKFAAAVDVLKPSIFLLGKLFPEPSWWSKRPLGNPQLHGTYTRALKGQHVKHPTSIPGLSGFVVLMGWTQKFPPKLANLPRIAGENFEKTKAGAFFWCIEVVVVVVVVVVVFAWYKKNSWEGGCVVGDPIAPRDLSILIRMHFFWGDEMENFF